MREREREREREIIQDEIYLDKRSNLNYKI
jgi:hypothetical protein